MWWKLHVGTPPVAAVAALLIICWQIQGSLSLVGENVCKEEQTYNITKRIRYEVPVTIRKYEWCLAIPPRCTRYITEIQEDTKMETEKRVEQLEVCCSGFQQRGQRCVPRCPAGRTGEKCDKECPPARWGASCSKACSCPERSSCDTRNGKCICYEGWGGTRCDREIDLATPSRPITFDQNSLDWTTVITFPTDMFKSTTISVLSSDIPKNKTVTFETTFPTFANKSLDKSLDTNTKLEKNEKSTNRSIQREKSTYEDILKHKEVTTMPNMNTQIVNPPVINNIAIDNGDIQETTIKPFNITTLYLDHNTKLQNITNIPRNSNNNFNYTTVRSEDKIRFNYNSTISNNTHGINAITITTIKPFLKSYDPKTIVTHTTNEKTEFTTIKFLKNYPITTQSPITRIKIKNITESSVNLNLTKSKNITFISPIFKFSIINNKTVGSSNHKDGQSKDTTITYISPSPKNTKNLDESKIKYTSPMKKVTTPSSISTTNSINKTTQSLTKLLENLNGNAQIIQRKPESLTKDLHSSTTNSLEADEVHILTEPEHITSVAGERGFDSSSDNLISVLSLVCGGVLALIVVAMIIVMVERRRKSRSEDINSSQATIEETEGEDEASTYMRSIFNSPLPDPPREENIKRSEVKSFHGEFLRPVVIHAISPIMVENFRDILESHYDHLPPRNLRPQSWFQKETPPSVMQMSNFDTDSIHKITNNNNLPVTESSIDTLKLKTSITDLEDIEPVYDEIPFWRTPSQYAIEVVNLNGEAVTEL